MHGKYSSGGGCPMTDAKRAALGDMHPDYSGPGYTAAKKMLIVVGPEDHEDDYGPDETAPTVGILEDLSAMADKLSQSSDLHAKQADKLRQIVDELAGPDADPDEETDRLTSGEPMA